MLNFVKRWGLVFIVVMMGLFFFGVYQSRSVTASVSDTLVYVCNDPWNQYPCAGSTDPYVGPITYDSNYVAQVLANEWPGVADEESLKAGAIAVRTFGWRDYVTGCGAVAVHKSVDGTQYRVENNLSQRYWLPNGTQNSIHLWHLTAVQNTYGITLRRHPGYDFACAKYKANCGNPTADGTEEPNTLIGVPDPVDSDTSYHLSGLSQNGSHAWELDGYAGAVPWSYQQILTHYYANVDMIGLASNRWVWLDVDNTVRYTALSGEQYYGPIANTSQTMHTGRIDQVPFHMQNTSPYTWFPGNMSLSYHWYDSSGSLVNWEGLRTSVGSVVYPGGDVYVQADVVAPILPGTYTLKWDMVNMVSSNSYWFIEKRDKYGII